jgi:hypothetical protein
MPIETETQPLTPSNQFQRANEAQMYAFRCCGLRADPRLGGRRLCLPILSLLLGLALSWPPKSARAEGKVVTISEVTIVGRVQKPIAAVDVSRIQPKMTLAELRQPFLERISQAIYRAPF